MIDGVAMNDSRWPLVTITLGEADALWLSRYARWYIDRAAGVTNPPLGWTGALALYEELARAFAEERGAGPTVTIKLGYPWVRVLGVEVIGLWETFAETVEGEDDLLAAGGDPQVGTEDTCSILRRLSEALTAQEAGPGELKHG